MRIGRAAAVICVATTAVSCVSPPSEDVAPAAPSPSTTVLTPTPVATPVTVPYRIERRTTDAATADFAEVVEDTLDDPRGWQRAGFDLVRREDAPYVIVLAEGDEVDALCRPYETSGRYSCQNGAVVALNADRWRTATSEWTGDLRAYRQMLVNHEVGHLLHLHHPVEPQCPQPGDPAPVMAQQSTELDGCRPNAWPLEWEVELAARREEPLAPGPDHDVDDHRPTPP